MRFLKFYYTFSIDKFKGMYIEHAFYFILSYNCYYYYYFNIEAYVVNNIITCISIIFNHFRSTLVNNVSQ